MKKNRLSKNALAAIALTLALALSACGNGATEAKSTDTAGVETKTDSASAEAAANTAETAESADAAGTTTYPLTISNHAKAEGGTDWTDKEQKFDRAPERVMANTRPTAELLLHLGLRDKIAGVGASSGEADPDVAEEYAKLNILGDSYVSKEVTLGVNPDAVIGRGGLFDNADWGVGTVDSLNEMGVKTYVLESSIAGGTYDSVYTDIGNLGQIFNVQDKARAFVDELKQREEAVTSKLSTITENKTYVYLHMSDPNEVAVLTLKGETFFNDVMNKIKLDNPLKDRDGDGSIEMLIEADPDVLIIPDFGNVDEVKKGLLNNPKLSSMQAIKNKQIYAMNYNYMFGYGYDSLNGVEILAKELYPDLFK
ncbi:ABC transporter substrate-binding protein [Saccharibacillus sp. CPCC 101409]|uniref:ABC transporter substrate-binding protein n=1 Tax=Saccharibacillus sp. CPCC 101409 TaxID=3058041 RepID=UPI00267191B6|nr:ABC transporter substrate-binding protein [Saccharibacillus sp. CPCC 101409]MDO3412372.1 ABC transporter substrate-binding protein [Saccharibacillus sp. CPCC 101409]